jgi:hypothetical protein
MQCEMTTMRVPRRWRRGVLGVILGSVLAAGCAGVGASIQIPADLPNSTNDQEFSVRWALETTPARVRAAGYVDTSMGQLPAVQVDLFGVDARGRVASRGSTSVPAPFTTGAAPFEVFLRPTGREVRYEVRVRSLDLHRSLSR